jgi:hypothetical protein
MKRNKSKKAFNLYGIIGKSLCACAGGIVGFIIGGPALAIVGVLVGGLGGHLLERVMLCGIR